MVMCWSRQGPRWRIILVVLVWAVVALAGDHSQSQEPELPNCGELIQPRSLHGMGRNCSKVVMLGMQGSGSTFVWQILEAVVQRLDAVMGRKIDTLKVHFLNRVNDRSIDGRCIVSTYRDFRDVICSHARRGGSQGLPACIGCDSTELEQREILVRTLGRLFHKGGQAQQLMDVDGRGALLLRYEHFVHCSDVLVDVLGYWLGVDLSESGDDYPEWKDRVLQDSSIEKNLQRAEELGHSFRKYDPQTGIHGRHISNGGKVGGWRTCMTPAVQAHVRNQLGSYLDFFNYTDWDTDTPV
uniref:Sulfotransferase domain-containing protein n=1 Tax=Rhizochromulina marina TaxID=1034831 RepID=A0A7S2W830_9STRA|mmetsp:Transcript_16892/g.49193  ORF Transcript_16892/g.49193 Transcript_16892/m.49193 type:complete len:297 (+) Transcript_16892:72-962(+)